MVIVTGGGIGRAVATVFAGRGAGVTILGRNGAKLRRAAEEIGRGVRAISADASRRADVAAAVHYLASPEASFVTGEVVNVNGGWLFGR